MPVNVQGLLGAIGALPSVITKGLLGPLPSGQGLGLDPRQMQQAQQSAMTDMAMGMVAGGRDPRTLMMARQNATGNYRERVFDLMREQELARVKSEREKRQGAIDSVLGTLGQQSPELAQLAAANPEQFVSSAIQAQFTPGADGRTDDIKEYAFAVEQGFQGTLQDWLLAQKKAGANSVNVNLPPSESELFKAIGKGRGEQFVTSFSAAKGAASTLEQLNVLEPLVNSPGFISGPWGETRLQVAKVLGLQGAEETQAYFAAVGRQVGENIKMFGAGTGLSDADREFAKQMAAGSIDLTPDAIKRIMRINRQVSEGVIRSYNEDRDFLGSKRQEVYDLYPQITAPGSIKITRIK